MVRVGGLFPLAAGLLAAARVLPAVDVEEDGPLLALTQRIDASTSQMQSDVGKLQSDVSNMNQVLMGRQQLIVAVGQMEALRRFGQVVAGNPAGSDGSSLLARMQGLLQGLAGGGTDSPLAAVTGLAGGVGSLPGLGSLPGVSQTVGEINGLTRAAGQLGSAFQSLTGLSFDGRGFSGANANQVSNLIGYLGQPVAMDQVAPTVLFPVPAQVAGSLGRVQNALRSAGQIAGEAGAALGSVSGLLGGDTSGLLRTTLSVLGGNEGAQAAVNNLVADGIYLRAASGADAAYQRLVANGGGGSRSAFYAATSREGRAGYDPLIGAAAARTGATRLVPADLDEVYSGGASRAVARYNAEHGLTQNPYTGYARAVAPLLAEELARTQPGQSFRVTAEMLRRARERPAPEVAGSGRRSSSRQRGPAERTGAGWWGWGWAVAGGPAGAGAEAVRLTGFRRVQLGGDGGSGTGGGTATVAVTPPLDELQEFFARLSGSTTRLTENSVQLQSAAAMLTYTNQALAAAGQLQQQLQGMARQMTARNALESVPLMLQNTDALILLLRRQAADYTAEVDRFQRARHTELNNRANYVAEVRERTAALAHERISRLLLATR